MYPSSDLLVVHVHLCSVWVPGPAQKDLYDLSESNGILAYAHTLMHLFEIHVLNVFEMLCTIKLMHVCTEFRNLWHHVLKIHLKTVLIVSLSAWVAIKNIHMYTYMCRYGTWGTWFSRGWEELHVHWCSLVQRFEVHTCMYVYMFMYSVWSTGHFPAYTHNTGKTSIVVGVEERIWWPN